MHALQVSFPCHARGICSFSRRRQNLQWLCIPPSKCLSTAEEENDNEQTISGRGQAGLDLVLVERYGDGTAKRYVLHEDSWVQTSLPDPLSPKSSHSNNFNFLDSELSWLPDSVKEFILPAGFPGSVSDDYLEYMFLQFPTNVTAWICHVLVTSSLLKVLNSFYQGKGVIHPINNLVFKAVGIGSISGTSAAASAAAIRWVSKDGIGAVGRLLIGGRFGNLFDDDPKQWRMYADFIGSAGSIFDLTTPLYPTSFLLLASLGNLAKAVARGLKDPSFRVIQSHFAIAGNLGEVAAKEEVWEVAAQLVGLTLGILILDAPGIIKSYPLLTFTWMTMRLLHLWLRYQSLSVLKFNTINLKRARVLVDSHVLKSIVPGCDVCNKTENILVWERFSKPRISFSVSFEEILLVDKEGSVYAAKELLKLYSNEKYVLTVDSKLSPEFLVAFKVGATSLSVLRSIWQSYCLSKHWDDGRSVHHQLKESLAETENRFGDFIEKLVESGWNTDHINIKVPTDILIDQDPSGL